jgi:hypothetical protein
VGANGFQFGARQTAHEADLMNDSVKVRAAMGIAEDVWASVIVARDFEQGEKIDAVHDGSFDVCAGKSYEPREQPVELFFDVLRNFFGFIIVEYCGLRIALAKDATVGQFSEITFDRQAADEAVVRELRTVDADVFLLFGDFVNNDVSHFADIVAANCAFVGDGGSAQLRRANERNQGQPDSKI